MLELVGLKLHVLPIYDQFRKAETGTSPRHSFPWSLTMARSGELHDLKAQEIVAHAHRLSTLPSLSFQQVSAFMGSLNWASVLAPLGRLHLRPLQRHFNFLGLTNWFTSPQRSDQSVHMGDSYTSGTRTFLLLTQYYSFLQLIVNLFLWLYSQDIILQARHIPGCLNVITDCLSRPYQPISHPEIEAQSL